MASLNFAKFLRLDKKLNLTTANRRIEVATVIHKRGEPIYYCVGLEKEPDSTFNREYIRPCHWVVMNITM